MGPEHHDVIIHEIVKEPGERVSNEELNNAINVDNKDHANVNEGVSLPTNLQSDTTQTVPTRITYRDGSIEIVNVPIRTHADKSSIRNALPKLNAQGDTNGKTPSSVNAYNNEMRICMMKLKQFEEKLMKCYQMIEQQILMLQMRQIILMMSH